jgi:hypothetical protein
MKYDPKPEKNMTSAEKRAHVAMLRREQEKQSATLAGKPHPTDAAMAKAILDEHRKL